MSAKKKRIARFLVAMLAFCLGFSLREAHAQQSKKPFTVADDIGFTHFAGFDDAYAPGFTEEGRQFSPNGDFFAVLTSRGRLDLNQVEASLRFYRTEDIEAFLKNPASSQPPVPVWVLNRTGEEQPICKYRWLADSSGVALVEPTDVLHGQIVLANLRKRTTEVLIREVGLDDPFSVTDREHYVYMAVDEREQKELDAKRAADQCAPMTVVTATSVWDVIHRDNPWVASRLWGAKKNLWAAVGGKPFQVQYSGGLKGSDFDFGTMALSPDGQTLVTALRVKEIPKAWEKLYPASYASSPYNNIHSGGSASQFVLLDLKTGSVQPLTGAPTADDAGWWAGENNAAWSEDGQGVLLPGTFLESQGEKPSRPCIPVVDVVPHTRSCVKVLKGRNADGKGLEEGYKTVWSAGFVGGGKDRIEMYFTDDSERLGTEEYKRAADGSWQLAQENEGLRTMGRNGLVLTMEQRLDEPPRLVASNKEEASKVLWDPNPQFADIELGKPRVYTWKDMQGRKWEGGLYMPPDYREGQRYPLVIQTHGFPKSAFLPAGTFPTAFAARELAAAGIAVLQIGGSKYCGTPVPEEASCEVAGFEAGARQLSSDGLVELQRVGYIGFSRSCWYGMEFLTNGDLRLKAALLADGIMGTYLEFVLFGAESLEMGAQPYGDGLKVWMNKSPGFHSDKVSAPLLITTEKDSEIAMWEPYAGLRALKKPVDLIMLHTEEHVITNPVERMASQGLTVDWFRFWLQGYEDPDPAKAEQYKRWRELRNMQEKNEGNAKAPRGS